MQVKQCSMDNPKPKMRPITIEAYGSPSRILRIEALTDEAVEWTQEQAPEFGELIKEPAAERCWNLFVHHGYNRDEVVAYLNNEWDSKRWPEDIETGRETK